MTASPDVEMPSAAWGVAHQETLDSILTKLTFIERRLKHYPSEATECIKALHGVIEFYDVRGEPRWLVKRIRKYSLRYHRALSVLYPHMEPTEKLALTKLMRFEATKRYSEKLKTDVSMPAALRIVELNKLNHVAEVWRTFLDAENSMLMRKEGPLQLEGSYEVQESFRWLCMNGSVDGKTEALSFLSENSDEVQTALRMVQGAHVEAEEELRNLQISPAETAELHARCKATLKRWWEDAKASGQVPEMYMGASRASGSDADMGASGKVPEYTQPSGFDDAVVGAWRSEPQPLTPEKISESWA